MNMYILLATVSLYEFMKWITNLVPLTVFGDIIYIMFSVKEAFN